MEEHRLFLDQEIKSQEILETIKALKNNTDPGRDG